MKHYSSLMNLETQIINLDVLLSLARVMTAGMKDARADDIENSMYLLQNQLEAIHNGLRSEFEQLFDVIREESVKDESRAKRNKK